MKNYKNLNTGRIIQWDPAAGTLVKAWVEVQDDGNGILTASSEAVHPGASARYLNEHPEEEARRLDVIEERLKNKHAEKAAEAVASQESEKQAEVAAENLEELQSFTTVKKLKEEADKTMLATTSRGVVYKFDGAAWVKEA